MSEFETIEDAVRVAGGAAFGIGCIHCGKAPLAVSVFCSTSCRDTCLEQCGSKSALGT